LGDRAGATLEWSFDKAERGNAAKESILWWRSSRWCRCALLCACGGDDDTPSKALASFSSWWHGGSVLGRLSPRWGVMMGRQPCCACLWVKTLSIPRQATTMPLASCPPWRYIFGDLVRFRGHRSTAFDAFAWSSASLLGGQCEGCWLLLVCGGCLLVGGQGLSFCSVWLLAADRNGR
jgi:hypothetical protein